MTTVAPPSSICPPDPASSGHPEALVKTDGETVTASLQFNSKQLVFSRNIDEPLSKLLSRVTIRVNSSPNNKKPKKKGSNHTENGQMLNKETNISLISPDGTSILPETSLRDCLIADNLLIIGDRRYRLIVDEPEITDIVLPNHIMATYVIQPVVTSQYTTHHRIDWFISANSEQVSDWLPVASDQPMVELDIRHVGRRVKIEVTPCCGAREGTSVEAEFPESLGAPVGESGLSERLVYTMQQTDSDGVRVVSYNILAEFYSLQDFSKQVMYPYCADYVLGMGYRKQMLYRELEGYHADVLCLQEVEDGFFASQLQPFLASRGLSATFHIKAGSVQEGEVVAFRESRFALEREERMVMSEYARENPEISSFLDTLTEQTVQDFIRRPTILQVCLLRDKWTERRLLVTNAHFAAKAMFDSVRLVQALCAASFVQSQLSTMAGLNVSLLFTGDLNSCPVSWATRYLQGETVRLPTEYHKPDLGRWPSLTCDLRLTSCYDPAVNLPYTTVVRNLTSVLDWVYTDESLSCVQALPPPALHRVLVYGGMPNVAMPSDHVALVCDLQYSN